MDLKALEANYTPINIASSAPQKKKLGGIAGLAANFLPTIGGGAGAALGTLVAPIAGTAAGGAVGAGLGEYLRQKLTGEADDGIDKGNLIQEGAFGALPGVFKGVKALKTARAAEGGIQAAGGVRGILTGAKVADTVGDASRVMNGVEQLTGGTKVAKAATQSTEGALLARKNALQKTGESLTRSGSGLKVGKNVGDIEKLDDLSQVASKYTGTPKTQLRKISADMGKLDNEVSTILSKNPIKVNGSDVGAKIQAAIDDPNMFTELDLGTPEAQRALQMHVDKFASSTSAKDVNDYIKTLNKTAVRAKDKLARGVNLTGKENAALAAKYAGDDVLKEFPEIAPIKQQMAQLFEINPSIASEAEKGFALPFTGGMKVKAPYQAVRGAQSRAGAITQAIAGGATEIPGSSVAGQVARASVPQAGYRAAGAAFGVPFVGSAQQPDTAIPVDETTLPETTQTAVPEVTASNSPYAPENIQNSLRKLAASGATQKDIAEFLSNAKIINDLTPAAKAGKPLSSEAAKTLSNAQAGLTAIDDFESSIAEDPGAFSRTNLPGLGVLDSLTGGRVAGALGTSGIDAASQQIVDIIARLRTGAAISKTEEARFKKFIPLPGDPENVRSQKLNYLRDQFSLVANRVQNSPQQDLETVSVGQ